MSDTLDDLDRRLIELLRVNARMPAIKLAQALGCSRTTVRTRLAALEKRGVIAGYTLSLAVPLPRQAIRALLMMSVDSRAEAGVTRTLARLPEIARLYSISGRYDLCALLATDSTEALDTLLDRIRAIPGVAETFSTVILSTKLNRPGD